jgi:hypothetical protein
MRRRLRALDSRRPRVRRASLRRVGHVVPTALRSPFDLEVEESVLLAQGAIKVRRGHSTLNLDNGHISLNLLRR